MGKGEGGEGRGKTPKDWKKGRQQCEPQLIPDPWTWPPLSGRHITVKIFTALLQLEWKADLLVRKMSPHSPYHDLASTMASGQTGQMKNRLFVANSQQLSLVLSLNAFTFCQFDSQRKPVVSPCNERSEFPRGGTPLYGLYGCVLPCLTRYGFLPLCPKQDI